MNSMTGFGRGEASNGALTVVVEIKTVNNRFRDLQVRVPREYNVLEPRILNLLREGVQRGRVEAMVRRSSVEGATRVVVDLALVDQYRRAFADVARRVQRDASEIPLASILAQPGVLLTGEAEADALAEWDLCEVAVQSALSDLAVMRGTEGVALALDLRKNLDTLLRLCAEVAESAEGVADRIRHRLEERLARLMNDRVDPARLAQEVAILADKSDISEEITRLASHCDQFAQALVADDPVGRKFDFLLQEMNREINTIGSKAAEHPVASRVLDMKSVLERMREQAANVE
ncbi:MAG: YicC/YloC family endoribonuclease [Pseudomonadota bacterium]|nr:YicC/YloC family endoribonuclease [Pseudomonadota bacterium]